MAVDPARRQSDMAKSLGWNTQRPHLIACILKGISPPGVMPDSEGFYEISRHAAGTRPAYVVQANLRKRYPKLHTKVVNTVDDDSVEWDAIIKAKALDTEGDTDGAH